MRRCASGESGCAMKAKSPSKVAFVLLDSQPSESKCALKAFMAGRSRKAGLGNPTCPSLLMGNTGGGVVRCRVSSFTHRRERIQV
jgi:hypothetical protein